MAETETKTKGLQYPKPKTSHFLCCFGSLPHETSTKLTVITGSDPQYNNINPKQNKSRSWFPWPKIRLRVKNYPTTTKTVPLEADEKEIKLKLFNKCRGRGKANKKVQYSLKWKKLKSNLPKSSLRLHADQTPATHPPPPRVLSTLQSELQSQTRKQNGENNNVDEVETYQHSSLSPTRGAAAVPMTRAVSLPTAKRQAKRLLSSTQSRQTTTSSKQQFQNAKKISYYDPIVGASVVMVALVVMVLWGRLCAILCTSASLYVLPRFRTTVLNNQEDYSNNANNDSNDNLDLDSKFHKKKVILEGLLQRNHRATM